VGDLALEERAEQLIDVLLRRKGLAHGFYSLPGQPHPGMTTESRGGLTASGQLADSLGLESFGQPLSRPAQPHVYRGGVDSQSFGNLFRRVLEGVPQGQNLSTPLGPAAERTADSGDRHRMRQADY